MKNEIKISEEVKRRLLNALNLTPDNRSWFKSSVDWMIDYKTRRKVKLTKFLKDQLENPNEKILKIIRDNKLNTGKYETRIIKCLRWVTQNIIYGSDVCVWGVSEYWATYDQTIMKRLGDCDDMNSLIYIMARLAGIPSYLLECAIGSTKSGGHYWTMFYSPSAGKMGTYYTIDATYYPSYMAIYYNEKTEKHFRPPFKYSEDRYRKIWYLFNENYCWKHK